MGTLGGIPLDVGDVLAKKYRLERLVGEGGTGIVVAARHLQLDRVVAIKFLRTALASDEIRLRFEREGRAIGQIESEHVVLVLDVGALPDDSPYMVMEYLEGRDLAKVLKEDGPLTIEDAVDCMLQVCEALAEAHAQGIVHRDLKPANLFLTRREDGGPHVKVVDFGISKILDAKLLQGGPKEMTNAFSVLGSPRYMAPEQVRNSKDVDGRADIWSLGAVLFQLITGTYAFEAENNVQASISVLTKEPTLLRSVVRHAPAELEAIVGRCLTKDRNARYQTVAELADALRPFASERTRESLDRMQQAKEAPSLNIALNVSSVMPPRLSSAPPPPVSQPPISFQGFGHGDLPTPPSRPTPPPPRAQAALPGSPLQQQAVAPSHAYSHPPVGPVAPPPESRPTPPSHHPPSTPTAPSAFRVASRPPPAGFDPGTPQPPQGFGRKPPSTALKVGIAFGGLLAVLLAFGILTLIKMAAQSVGVLSSSTADPDPSPPAASILSTSRQVNGPSQAVTVTLDAGRAPP